ncbi:RluA family pseudouridine synthase [Salibacterium salarium]|uniref:Pseudouridine synthase n=1 Tax=Salibacterium salarium TaxID=284579 RepID=A0A428MYX8_9BACI|nr:RluA family pseudouridine synthase [Salibacterium salarium]RSL31363.1 RluA family pseudouridine synthase [Salibacterium salarium]
MKDLIWNITKEEAGQRIDKFLTNQQEDWSRTIIQSWIKEKRILVNDQMVKSNYILQETNTVTLTPEEEKNTEVKPENIDLDIVYEDEDIIVVNKPRGMVIHPAPGHSSGTVVNALLYHCETLSNVNGEWRPGIVHRIDKDTSGLLIAAKNDTAHLHLSDQLQEKRMERFYQAIVHGNIPHDTGTIEAPIGRDPKDRQKMAVTEKNAKDAVTHFSVLEHFDSFTYVECKLDTGRTHQIRVHMKYIGHPLAGDPKYGRTKTLNISGQALHAGSLRFVHPTKETPMELKASLPEDMTDLLDNLRKMY